MRYLMLVTRLRSATGPDGRITASEATSRLRLQRTRAGWKVVDGYLSEEAAWVSTMLWQGVAVAA